MSKGIDRYLAYRTMKAVEAQVEPKEEDADRKVPWNERLARKVEKLLK